MKIAWIIGGVLGLVLGIAPVQGKVLWEIGKADNNDREFALSPNGHGRFKEDGFCAVGQFDAKRDWPYVQPGPGDPWAGGRPHTFVIVFGLKQPPGAGQCKLMVDLLDTHRNGPPMLQIDINGRTFKHQTPPGGGDESIFGDPSKGKEHKFEIAFEADLLKAGLNEIDITTAFGSWVLYDWVGMEAPDGAELAEVQGTAVRSIKSLPALVQKDGKLWQTVQVGVRHFGADSDATVKVSGAESVKATLKNGTQDLTVLVPAVEKETSVDVGVEAGGKVIAEQKQVLKPVRKWEIYLLPHSHVDIGYTHLQSDVMKLQWKHLEVALEASKRTADYPAGAQFKWNVEVMWAVDAYLKNATPEKRAEFIDAVKKGWVGLQALYGNELTALCRPEELVRLVDCAKKLEKETGVAVDSAMISDVPGYTWGMVPVFANSGVKYFSVGPNQGDRIGYTLSAWGDKPFWWIGPNGKDRILCWIAGRGYSSFHGGGLSRAGESAVFGYLRELEQSNYPYDMVQVRYNTGGDNGPPDVAVSEFVKAFNTKYAYPKLIIATSSELCGKFDEKYGKTLPEVTGDFTPYWEDGAASSARETAINREAAERLSQAEALWVMLNPRQYPADKFYQAWHNVILYDEHTWGAHNSISEPDKDFVKAQWKIKAQFALDAEKESKELLKAAVGEDAAPRNVNAVDVFNTLSWTRTDLVTLPKEMKLAGNVVSGPDQKVIPSQRLSTGELVFLAKDVPAFGSRRYALAEGKADAQTATKPTISTSFNAQTGAIDRLQLDGLDVNFADVQGGIGLNAYRYVPGANPKDAKPAGDVKITLKENGPVVMAAVAEGDAPGCNKLIRELRMMPDLDRVDIINTLDKQAVRKKEGVHFGFAFNVPNGVMRMDIPFAVVRPELDQLKGACKNWFTVQRWVDVSNDDYGVTWATLDAPLVEVGAITADVTGGVPWIEKLQPSQTLYSYVMNNYWHTNYKADQDGPTVFRYAIRPHKKFDPVAAAKFGVQASQPLVVVPAGDRAPIQPRLKVEGPGVIVTALKPSEDGKAWIVRLFAASGKPEQAKITFADPAPQAIYLSDITEKQGEKLTGPIDLPPYGMVTIRAQTP